MEHSCLSRSSTKDSRADALLGRPPVVALEAVIDAFVDLPMVTDTETHVVRDLAEH